MMTDGLDYDIMTGSTHFLLLVLLHTVKIKKLDYAILIIL